MSQDDAGTLVVLTCHGVYDGTPGVIHAEHPADRPIYDAQLAYAFAHVQWRAAAEPLLVISGGPTKAQRPVSEAESYLERARQCGLVLPAHVEAERFAMTSVENLLFSLYVYHRRRHAYPARVEVISWEFKRRRFEKTMEAITRWLALGRPPVLSFFPAGDLSGAARAKAVEREEEYIASLEAGIDAYYASPAVIELIRERDVHGSRARARSEYADYPLPFPSPAEH